MAIGNLSHKILEISQRVENIRMQSLSDPDGAAEILADAIKELQISVEELSVAEEELCQQSEELANSHNALKAERQRYMELFDQVPDGYLVTDQEGNIQEANHAAADMLNIRQDLLAGRPMMDFVIDTDHSAFRAHLAQIQQGAEVSDSELLLQPLEGVSIPVSISVSLVRDSRGQLTGLRWLLHDITARKKIEKARQAAKDILEINNLHTELKPFLSDCVAYLKNFSGCNAVGIRILDREGNIPYQAYGGFSQSFFEMESPLSIKSDLCMCINVVKGETDPSLPFYTPGGSFYMNGTTRFLATVSEEAKGQTRNVCNKVGYESVALIPIRLRDKILGLIHLADPRENIVPLYLVEVIEQVGAQIGVALDRIQAEAALRESEAELKLVTDGVPLPLAHVSSDLKYIFVNQSYVDWFQIPKEEIVGRHISEVLSREGYEATFSCIKMALSGERTDYEFIIQKDGRPHTLNIAFIPQMDGQGAVWSYYTITQDITERKRAEEARRESEERLRFVLETCHIGAWDMDIEDHTTIRSPEHDRVYGYDVMLPQWTYEMFLEHVVPEDRAWVDATYQHAVKTQSSWSFEFRIRRPDGQVRWIWATGSHRRDADSAVRRVAGIVQDITERKRAEEALRESETRFRIMADSSPIIIWVTNVEGGVRFVNRTYREFFGVTYEQVEGGKWQPLIHPDDAPEYLSAFLRSVRERTSFKAETRVLRADGEWRWVMSNAEPLFSPSGEFLGHVGTSPDITERKRAEGVLQTNLQRFYTVLSSMYAGILLVTDKGQVEYANQAFCDLFDLKDSPADLMGLTSREMIEKIKNAYLRPEEAIARITEIVNLGQSVRGEEVAMRGERTFVRDFVPIYVDGKSYGRLWHHLNITERKQMEMELWKARDELELKVQERTAELYEAKENLEVINEELQVEISEHEETEKELLKAKEAAEAAVEAKAAFLANMSHELRTPMNAVIGYSSLLLDDSLTPEQKDYVESIKSGGEALLSIINDILEFSRAEKEKVLLERQPLSLKHCIDESLDMVAVHASKKGLNLACTINYGTPDTIIGDPGRIRQVLVNLLSNAVKFTDYGDISVSVFSKVVEGNKRQITFAVRDTGIGIPQDKMDRLFKPFTQLEYIISRKRDGAGLGLAICKKLVELMGGEIWVESEEGKGSTFRFTILAEAIAIPGRQPDFGNAGRATAYENLSGHMPLSILVADDNPSNQKVLIEMLKRMGYRPDAVADGREVLQVLGIRPYDLIFMDIRMPEMDGLTATREIRRLWPDKGPKVIAITAFAMEGDREKCLEAGMDGYIAKPVRIEDLAAALCNTPVKE